MTAAEREAIAKLDEKMDRLPDAIIGRLDDRYLKKDDAEKIIVGVISSQKFKKPLELPSIPVPVLYLFAVSLVIILIIIAWTLRIDISGVFK